MLFRLLATKLFCGDNGIEIGLWKRKCANSMEGITLKVFVDYQCLYIIFFAKKLFVKVLNVK